MLPKYLPIIAFVLINVSPEALAASPSYVSRQYPRQFATGLVRDAKALAFQRSAPRKSFVLADEPVPGSFSLRGKAGPVENQGNCGSCWDFSLTSVLRGTYMTTGADPGRLSFNYLLNCATDQWGCSGGWFNAADWLTAPRGAPAYGADGTYTAQEGKCIQAPVQASSVDYHMLGFLGFNPTFKDIAYVVGVLHRPVSVDLFADDNWMSYGQGVFDACRDGNSGNVNHMVSVEGYSCGSAVDSEGNCIFDAQGRLPNGVGTWIIRNSWGAHWGDDGYITMKATNAKGQLCNSIGADALYFDVN